LFFITSDRFEVKGFSIAPFDLFVFLLHALVLNKGEIFC